MTQDYPSLPKRILVDANFLVALVNPKADDELKLRITTFIEAVEKQRCTLVIPMPAFAEYLVGADTAGVESITLLERKTYVLMANFDRAAAFECALLDSSALGRGDKKDGSATAWQKIKVDRQIVAIGKANGVRLVISRDGDVKNAALRAGMDCMAMADLPLPASSAQRALDFSAKKTKPPAAE